jgi:hypothetical protein
MLKQITKFSQIKLIPNSLIVLDIDDTIIKFDKINIQWWHDTFDKHYVVTKDYVRADFLSLDEWISHVTITEPKLVDDEIYNWIGLTNKFNCDLIFLTARNLSLKDITQLHLNKVNLYGDESKIYFNRNKGDELLSIANGEYLHKKNIIVVDDVESNLTDIQDKFTDSSFNLHLYMMNA